MTSPKTLFSAGMPGTFGTGRRGQLYSLADVVTELKRSNELHAGTSLFIVVVGAIEGEIDRADVFLILDLISDG